jgi:hypothetical protein
MKMKQLCYSLAAIGLFIAWAIAQVADAPDEIKSGVPVNYTEAKAGTYTLPDPLKRENGQRCKNMVLQTAAGAPILHTLGYFMHTGGHGIIGSDWAHFYKFLEMHLR